ncbi:MAG TPA: DUF6173 family protein [Geobacteraceae bacterium]
MKNPFDGIRPNLGSVKATAVRVEPAVQSISRLSDSTINPARWTYKRLAEYINDFESDLDEEHEIGARLVSFGSTVVFHIENIGYYGPDIISFDGINDKGEKVQLIQNISQLSVLLVAMKKIGENPRRIGFKLVEDNEEDTTE